MRKLFLLPFVFLLSCVDSDVDLSDLDIEVTKNIPVISNVGNVYSLALYAEDFSLVDQASVVMDSALVLSIVVAEYSSGSLRFSVYAEDSSVVFDREISSNIVISEFPSMPARSLRVELSEFSGKVSLSLTEAD